MIASDKHLLGSQNPIFSPFLVNYADIGLAFYYALYYVCAAIFLNLTLLHVSLLKVVITLF